MRVNVVLIDLCVYLWVREHECIIIVTMYLDD